MDNWNYHPKGTIVERIDSQSRPLSDPHPGPTRLYERVDEWTPLDGRHSRYRITILCLDAKDLSPLSNNDKDYKGCAFCLRKEKHSSKLCEQSVSRITPKPEKET